MKSRERGGERECKREWMEESECMYLYFDVMCL